CDLWRSQWQLPSEVELNVDHDDADLQFDLPGPAVALGEAIYQFLEGALSAHNNETTTPRAATMYATPRVHMRLNLEASELNLSVDSANELPGHIDTAIREVNIFDRLPSG